MNISKRMRLLTVVVLCFTLTALVVPSFTALAQRSPAAAEGPTGITVRAAPSIRFTYVPPYGSYKNLKGRAYNVPFKKYRVAVYIYVVGGWWTKPYWNKPRRPIDNTGKWGCDITTGGVDQLATEIIAFLIPKSYFPPKMSGGPTLPDELYTNSVAYAYTTRSP